VQKQSTTLATGDGQLASCVEPRSTYLVKRLQEAMRLRLDEITRQFGLTTRQWTALSVLTQYPGISSAGLARLTFVSPQAANELVMTLERKGFLKRSVDQSNRRRLEVELTSQATGALAACDLLVDGLERQVFSGVDPEEEAQFRRLLQICLHALNVTPS
jgi:DNA-binding MarR family transcriptional regulator